MDAMENLMTRRSIRRYQDRPVEKELLEKIAEAGTWAPTGHNRQSPALLIVTDRAVRDELSRLNAAVMGTDNDPFYGAPAVIAVLTDPSVPTCVEDGSLVLGQLLLAAHALGLGACWINRARQVFATEEGRAILRKAGVNGQLQGVGFCIVGYADETPAAKQRKTDWIYRME